MAYDEDLAHRIRELLADETGVSERGMFGGLAFLVGGHMALAASGSGGIMVRIDPGDLDAVLRRDHVARMVMKGRELAGWITVAPEGLQTRRQLASWVARGVAYVKTLPAK